MKATKEFYKSWHDETSKMYQRVQDDEAAMTDEDRKADKARSKREFEKIWSKALEVERHTKHIPIPFQKRKFARLVKMALEYAEDDCVDISYETTEEHGFLRFEMGQVIIDDIRPHYWRVWRRLLRHADTFWVNPIEKYGDPAVQFTFFFKFQKRIVWKGFNK